MQQLLEQGADLAARDGIALVALSHLGWDDPAASQRVLLPMLQRGLDPLAPAGPAGDSLLVCMSGDTYH